MARGLISAYTGEITIRLQAITWCAAIRIDVGIGGFLELCSIPDSCGLEGNREFSQDDGNLDVRVSWEDQG